MNKKTTFIFIVGILVALILGACAPDKQLGYQAVLTGPGGIPVANGSYTVNVKFWKGQTTTDSADLVYQDTQTATVTNGILNIAIPDLTTEADVLDPGLFSQVLWVEFTINGQTLSPRQKLLGTPYAFTLAGGSVVSLRAGQEGPIVSAHPNRGALTVINNYASTATNSPGTTGLVVAIADNVQSEVIRACAGGTIGGTDGCSDSYVVFRVRGNGNVTADGTITGGGADFAEMIRFDGDAASVEPGDVLVISPSADRAVVKSSVENDTMLVGVVSTKPGFLGGGAFAEEEDYVAVAMMGIVPVKVTAANGAIQRGDLLTTSSIPGYAMKATDPQLGAVLGKAMGELLEGEGVIEVYLLPH
ncbi:MAG: hypothetical protein AB1453_14570 [Chloroflexota bacterium]